MSNTQKISNAILEKMSPEDLLMLGEDQIQLVTDRPLLPDGFYHFTLEEHTLGEVGKEKEKAILVSLVITAVNALTNAADQPVIDALDLASNPVPISAAYNLQSKNGYGLRDYMTFTSELGQRMNALTAADRMEKLNGASGVLHLTVNTYLPSGQPDVPENYKSNNRIKSTDVIWD